MQPRQQPQSSSGPRGPRPVAALLALLLLLSLQGAGAAPALPGEPEEPEDDYARRWLSLLPLWRSLFPRSRLPIDEILDQAASAALHFLNFRMGSPSALRALTMAEQGRAWVISGKEYKAELSFSTKRYNPKDGKEEPLGDCSAQVHFKDKRRPAVNVTCAQFLEKSKQQQEDYLLYKQLKQLKSPVGVVSIPDSNGYIDPSLRPVWDLASLGSSYVMWAKTTSTLRYNLSQLTGVKQWKTDDSAIDFDYTVLLHEFSTQEIVPCRIHLIWYPGKRLKVKYHCQEQQTPDEASGTEEGSAVAPTEPSNF